MPCRDCTPPCGTLSTRLFQGRRSTLPDEPLWRNHQVGLQSSRSGAEPDHSDRCIALFTRQVYGPSGQPGDPSTAPYSFFCQDNGCRKMDVAKFSCSVCGYPGLKQPPRSKSGGPSDQICPCCGFHFGYDDDARGISYETWRIAWTNEGMRWFSTRTMPPLNWEPEQQLRNAGLV